jgi:hypothetical protein
VLDEPAVVRLQGFINIETVDIAASGRQNLTVPKRPIALIHELLQTFLEFWANDSGEK